MNYRGSSAYDQSEFFSNYLKRRDRKDSPNNAIEGPIIYELIGDFTNRTVLDLGCGDARFGKELLENGAKQYTGLEGSKQMAATAIQQISGMNGEIHLESMESFHYPQNEYDLVTSRFAIHYVDNIQKLFNNVHHALKENGKFVFSVQHPLTTSSFESKKAGDRRENWIVDDYFIVGERKEPWMDEVVIKFHRTIEQYFQALVRAGFQIVDLREGEPKIEHFSNEEEFKRRLRIPVVLAFSCVK
ncbi:bifunctional 2-polyprenyl-6-hydroxyphenol methylase/3-demethylubiquinol 3-O-methyltransferase UbiG [Psychrobacillus sp. FJAT-21963]|uniref:class I SAM-dependent methyltransferase n=1 Tax=Psychrobacillus sp. FJAT-21963 TaxID=1712028 RepID=UPI0006FD9B71|nr:class I SAM-dependent methyltransferase [Psychrobacillus sp. FJAT-21963]KQL37171.1 methyltransferase [Psychrobacillus sp. FJAT-21963]